MVFKNWEQPAACMGRPVPAALKSSMCSYSNMSVVKPGVLNYIPRGLDGDLGERIPWVPRHPYLEPSLEYLGNFFFLPDMY